MMDSKIHCSDEHDAYQAYLLGKEEYPHYRQGKRHKEVHVMHTQFLIMELYRLVPYVRNRVFHFHPLNMPYINIGKIEIVGVITAILSGEPHFEYQVQDGTGTLAVTYKKDRFGLDRQDDQKYKQCTGTQTNNKSKHTDDGELSSKKRRQCKYRNAMFECYTTTSDHTGWSKRSCSDHVYATGYLTLDFNCNKFVKEDFTIEDLSVATPKLVANSMRCISEKDYNEKIQMWINSAVAERYSCSMLSNIEGSHRSVTAHEELEPPSELLE